jgi:hypothetical protein
MVAKNSKNKLGKVHINVILRRLREPTVAVEKKIITYSECVYVALVIQHAKHLHLVTCSLPGSTIFFHITS